MNVLKLINRYNYCAIFAAYFFILYFNKGLYTKKEYCEKILDNVNIFNLTDLKLIYFLYFTLNAFVLNFIKFATTAVIRYFNPSIFLDKKNYNKQIKNVNIHILLLSFIETFMFQLTVNGYTKVHLEPNSLYLFLHDAVLWIVGFEMTLYLEHRIMHDNYYIWKYIHSYHHKANKRENLLGITLFYVNHFEVFFTMSSAYVLTILFPINYYNKVAISLIYLILTFLSHWEMFPYKYHIIHHKNLMYNFGANVPIFDILFNTYRYNIKN